MTHHFHLVPKRESRKEGKRKKKKKKESDAEVKISESGIQKGKAHEADVD